MNTKKYVIDSDAIGKLQQNGCRVEREGSFIVVTGEPGLHLLGAIDFLRKSNTVLLKAPQQKKVKHDAAV